MRKWGIIRRRKERIWERLLIKTWLLGWLVGVLKYGWGFVSYSADRFGFGQIVSECCLIKCSNRQGKVNYFEG